MASASMKGSHQKLSQNEDEMESNRGIENGSKFLSKSSKWIIIGLFIFFFIILLVLITALCLVFIEVMSVQQQQQLQPVSIANVKHITQIEELPQPAQVVIEDNALAEPSSPSAADLSHLVQQPTDQQVQLGKDTTLTCKFEDKVHCRWLRKSNLVDISTRYSYIEPQLEDGNSDCSIKITNVKNIDLTEWQCVGVFNDQSSSLSNVIKLQTSQPQLERNEVVMEVPPENVTAKVGDDVRLDCKFNQKVNCAWMRRGEHIEIKGRYTFSAGSDQQLADCSIVIRKVKTIDAGSWICSSMADSNSAGLTSSPVTLTLTS